MSRAVIQKALDSTDAGASLVAQALTGLGITDPAEHQRAAQMLKAGIDFYAGKRGHHLDTWFKECGSFENALAVIGSQYRATPDDLEAFTSTMDGMASVMDGQETIDDLYPEDEGEEEKEEGAEPEEPEEGEEDHRADPDDPHWRDQEASQPANRSIEIPTRAAWEEPKFLDKAGNVINELPEVTQTDNGPHRYRNE